MPVPNILGINTTWPFYASVASTFHINHEMTNIHPTMILDPRVDCLLALLKLVSAVLIRSWTNGLP